MKQRCINIDWLEVYCIEQGEVGYDANGFRAKGYEVREREYGTPQYKEMFTIYENGNPFMEVRRNPYSVKKLGGIFPEGACHIRLSNRTCYMEDPVQILREFILANSYSLESISRIDICLDFNYFDRGDNPENIIQKFMSGEISKINQCNISAHGQDWWNGRRWNSLKWGSDRSQITTKLYNKSLEMKQCKEKTYIVKSWEAAGLDMSKDVWRVEFSCKSELKNFIRLDTGELMRSTLSTYENRDKCLFMFHVLASRYFHFKNVERTRLGTLQRKDRCSDKVLIITSSDEQAYKPIRISDKQEAGRTEKLLIKKMREILDNEIKYDSEQREAAKTIIDILITTYTLKKRGKDYDIIFARPQIAPRTEKQEAEYMRKYDENARKYRVMMMAIAKRKEEIMREHNEKMKELYRKTHHIIEDDMPF